MSSIITPEPPPALVVPDLSGDVEGYIKRYVAIRDKIAEMKKRHTAEKAPLQRAIDMLEAGFQTVLVNAKTDSMAKKGAGTIYLTTRRAATISEPELFRRYVIGAEQWDLVDWKANAVQVHKSMTENSQEVPGVKYSESTEVGVRRA